MSPARRCFTNIFFWQQNFTRHREFLLRLFCWRFGLGMGDVTMTFNTQVRFRLMVSVLSAYEASIGRNDFYRENRFHPSISDIINPS
jgi:hypothetical protein